MKTLTRFSIILILVMLTACVQPSPTPAPTAEPTANMANPASVFCEQEGGKVEIQKAADGSESGICLFPDGSQCDEWAFFRGECAPSQPAGTPEPGMANPASVFCEQDGGKVDIRKAEDGSETGYCVFPDASECEEWAYFRGECAPGGAAAAGGAGMANPASVFCEQQGGKLEIRTGSDGGQFGMCLFPDGSECEEWAFFRGECAPGAAPAAVTEAPPAVEVAPLPTLEGGYEGWQKYIQPEYGFSFVYPPGWTVEEVQGEGNTMSGHQVKLAPPSQAPAVIHVFLSFKQIGDDQIIRPMSMGAGELVSRGTAVFMGQQVNRQVLVCQGQDMQVDYMPAAGGTMQGGNMEFSVILNYSGQCGDGFSIPLDYQSAVDMIVASLALGQ
jgi:uncharacterized protein